MKLKISLGSDDVCEDLDIETKLWKLYYVREEFKLGKHEHMLKVANRENEEDELDIVIASTQGDYHAGEEQVKKYAKSLPHDCTKAWLEADAKKKGWSCYDYRLKKSTSADGTMGNVLSVAAFVAKALSLSRVGKAYEYDSDSLGEIVVNTEKKDNLFNKHVWLYFRCPKASKLLPELTTKIKKIAKDAKVEFSTKRWDGKPYGKTVISVVLLTATTVQVEVFCVLK